MTIYEQIQRSLNLVEDFLFEELDQRNVAKEAGMSIRSFRHYFWMITGYSYKEYIVKRRLAAALRALQTSDKTILEIALDVGYQNHESLTRAFKHEFKILPKDFRQGRPYLDSLEKMTLYKEMFMGIVIKELLPMTVVTFTGFAPDPERKAKEKLRGWLDRHPLPSKPHRIFGHNIDRAGNQDCNPQNVGYKFFVTVDGKTEDGGGGHRNRGARQVCGHRDRREL